MILIASILVTSGLLFGLFLSLPQEENIDEGEQTDYIMKKRM